jgi:HEAT repeat protein
LKAASVLGKMGSEKAIPLLVEALTDESSDVRGSAASALEAISKKSKRRIFTRN